MIRKHIKKLITLVTITITISTVATINNYNYHNIKLHRYDVVYINNNQLVITNTKDKSKKIIRKLDKDSKIIVLKNNTKIQEYTSDTKADLIFYNYNNLKLKISN